MNNGKKQQQKNKILIGLIIVVVVQIVPVLLSMTGMSEGTAAVIAVLFVMAFVWLIFFTIFKKLRSMNSSASAPGAKGLAKKTNVEFSDGLAGLVERMAKRDEEEVRRYQRTADQDCEYGDENHSFSHDSEQRLAQLDSFLKNGIIDRAEYQALKKRYSQSDNK